MRQIIIGAACNLGAFAVVIAGCGAVNAVEGKNGLPEGVAVIHRQCKRAQRLGNRCANLAAGGRGVVQALTEREWWIVEQVKPLIAEQNLYLVGLDVIGGYLTELNVTSPTCLREIEKATGQHIACRFWEGLA